MSEQTDKKDPNNRGLDALYTQLWTVWQGWPDSNRQDHFWRVAV